MTIRSVMLAAVLFATASSTANAALLFSDTFTGAALGPGWSSNNSGTIVAAPVGGGNALTFTQLGSGGDLFSSPIAGTGAGTFALIDYVNFKGEGTKETERYRGEGWGLLQVLAGMRGTEGSAVGDFAESAARVLSRRVQNAPAERHEERWLPGWKSRVRAYAN